LHCGIKRHSALPGRIGETLIAGTGNIIYGNVIIPGKYQQIINGDSSFSTFIVTVGALSDVQEICYFLLGQGVIFT
jgi:hypothetical protein